MTAPWRRVPSGVGLYDRGNPALYPAGSAPALAVRYGCSWVAVECTANARVQVAADARARGLRVWAWSYPSEWRPETWERGVRGLERALEELQPDGVICDIEDWGDTSRGPGWRRFPGKLELMANKLGALARRAPLALTTFPSWGGPRGRAVLRESVPFAWVQPQCYGVHSGSTIEQTVSWADAWSREWRQPVIPALAAWSYGADYAADYYAAWSRKYRGFSLWTSRSPWTDAARVQSIRSLRTRPSPWKLGALACAAAGAGIAISRYG